MRIHHYHPATGEYVGSSEAVADPLETGRFLIPAQATTETPPDSGPGHEAVFTGGGWEILEDHRGETVYRRDGGTPLTIETLGALPEDVTRQAPATANDAWDGTRWITPPPAVSDIKREARRRLADSDWYALRKADTGKAIPEAIAAWRAAVRAASNALEKRDPIPADYHDGRHWPQKPGTE